MQVRLSEAVARIVQELERQGFEAWIVGGAVRDLLLGNTVSDWDVTTSATPEQIVPLFPDSFYDNEYGTVRVAGKHVKVQYNLADEAVDDSSLFDITTYRSEGEYSDKRRPDSVVWGKSIQEDLKRRDFTINAIALRIKSEKSGEYECELVDPYDGQKDLKNKLIRAVGDPKERFQEDALRIMRAIRIAAQLGFTIEPATLAAMTAAVPNLSAISWERIGAETMKLLASPHAADAVLLMGNTGVLDIVMPELLTMKNVEQAGHHIYDVFTHSAEALRACPSPDPVVRLATLLHDVGKPATFLRRGDKQLPTFYNHEVVGARTARDIAVRLRLPKKDIQRVFTLVRWHMFAYEPTMTDAAIRRFIRRIGLENIHDMLDLRVGDRVGGGSKATSWRLTELQKRIGEQLYEPLSLKDLKINGADVMRILNIKPSKKIGEILNTLFEEIIDDPAKNTKEQLEKRVSELARD